MTSRELFHYCAACGKDFPARTFRADGIFHGPHKTGWRCPNGHVTVRCDESRHEWVPDGAGTVGQHCIHCDATRMR